ncbi:MAG: YciK family oxidoreductase [Gammaproteobacteria bacterium]|nr:YciK family oxidoreductase [Gammaproteobacteria bacterium]
MAEKVTNYQPAPTLFKDKVILVTGAGQGIGAAVSVALAKHGATVILLGRTPRKLEETYDLIEEAGGPTPAIYPMNLEGAKPEDYANLADTIIKEFGHLDGLLHNASILAGLTPLEQHGIEQWYKIMQINLHAPFLMTQALMPALRAAESASILFTSSSVGRQGRAYWGAYAISKAGNESMMQILADELETNTNIRANSINPGATRTSMRARAYPGEDPESVTKPEEIVDAYLYLLSDDSSEITGQQFDAQ